MKLTIPEDHWQWLRHGTARVDLKPFPALLAAQAWLDTVPDRWLLILASEGTGSGKSMAAAWLLTRLEEMLEERAQSAAQAKARSPRGGPWWCQVQDFAKLEHLRPWEKAERVGRLHDAWVLVLDDVGTEPEAGELQAVLEHRRASNLLTICTTNLVDKTTGKTSEAWKERYDRRLSSRMTRPGDAERGGAASWCHVPHPDQRSRTEPRILPPPAPIELVERGPEINAMLARLQNAAPAIVAERQVTETRLRIKIEDAIREANRRKVWGGLALDELAMAAQRGDGRACDILDNVARRAAGSET